jgi:hypothetical protein
MDIRIAGAWSRFVIGVHLRHFDAISEEVAARFEMEPQA